MDLADIASAVKIENLSWRAAMMAAPVFQTFGIEYGDQIPGVYKLHENLQEYIGDVIEAYQKRGNKFWQRGGFIFTIYDDQLYVSLDLDELNIA